jgi:VanZ family protein
MLTNIRLGFVLYVLVIVVLSLFPSGDTASIGVWDKVGHFLAYALMTLIGLFAFESRRARLLVIIFCLTLGVALEILQALTSAREPSIADGIANVAGVAVGMMMFRLG